MISILEKHAQSPPVGSVRVLESAAIGTRPNRRVLLRLAAAKPAPSGARLLRNGRLTFWGVIFLLLAPAVYAQEAPPDLTQLGIERLMDITVTSVAKKDQQLLRTPSAIYVITAEDIRRSGASSIPEVLRMVPGLQIAQIDERSWAISARGFNGRFANMMLVLIDGRSVYTPLFGGVYWDVQDRVLEDVERIEVIRGPGATMWGANAVNGVINIITRNSSATEGGLVTAQSGTAARPTVSTRYGGTLGANGHYRVFAKYSKWQGLPDSAGRLGGDYRRNVQGGFRADWQLSRRDSFTLEGDIYGDRGRHTVLSPSLAPPYQLQAEVLIHAEGGDLLARWTGTLDSKRSFALQAYYDNTRRHEITLGENRNTVDVEFQYRFPIGARQDVMAGLAFNSTEASLQNSFTFSIHLARPVDRVYSSFVQDEISILRDRLLLTVGAKLEHNPYSGMELQPNIRLAWTPSRRHMWWFAVSRAARTPTPGNTAIRVNTAVLPAANRPLSLVSIFGDPEARSTYLKALESGYRVQPSPRFYFDLAAFYNRYANLNTNEPGIPFLESDPLPLHLVLPSYVANMMSAETYGGELVADWKMTRLWNVSGTCSLLRIEAHPAADSRDSAARNIEGNAPRVQFDLRSHLQLPRRLELDFSLSRVGALSSMQVPAYTRVDVRTGRKVGESVEISAGAQNLLRARHLEFDASRYGLARQYVGRAIYGKVLWRF